MGNESTPVGPIVLVGRAGYQIHSEVWNGKLRFHARVGKPFKKKETGERGIVSIMEADGTDDFVRAAEAAKHQLEHIRQADFQREVEQQASTVQQHAPQLVAAGVANPGSEDQDAA